MATPTRSASEENRLAGALGWCVPFLLGKSVFSPENAGGSRGRFAKIPQIQEHVGLAGGNTRRFTGKRMGEGIS